ncbi:DUF2442 domain-containing protein [Salinarimonas sp.]|uniref:DUF2442 domain-containing protein n=1 Tax=Salinarimonas sp. TaxID=2766526 RepID=UPI0032D9547F
MARPDAEYEDDEFDEAARRTEELRAAGYAVSAHYDHVREQIVVSLSDGTVMRIDPTRTRALNGAAAEDLAEIEIMGAGVILYWPRLDEGVSLSVMRERFPPEGGVRRHETGQ